MAGPPKAGVIRTNWQMFKDISIVDLMGKKSEIIIYTGQGPGPHGGADFSNLIGFPDASLGSEQRKPEGKEGTEILKGEQQNLHSPHTSANAGCRAPHHS